MGYSHATASADQPSGRGSTPRPKRPLTRVLLAEYLELGRRLYGEYPSLSVHAEARAFLSHMARLTSRDPDARFPLGFRERNIRVGVVLAGDRERAAREGARPYVRACQWHMKRGVGAVYILGRGARRAVVTEAASELEKDGRVLAVDLLEYFEERQGQKVPAICARIVVDFPTAGTGAVTAIGAR